MITIVAIDVLITGAMLLCGGIALALDSPETKSAGVVMGISGAALLLLTVLAIFLLLAGVVA